MKAVIMAGGKGTRLKEITHLVPKPMLEIEGRPILYYQIEILKRYGISDIIIIIGYLGDKIKKYFKNGQKFGVNISYINEKIPLGTAGSLYYLRNIITGDFILVYADIFHDVNLTSFINFHKQKKAVATLLVHPNSHPYDSDLVILNNENRVIDIDLRGKTRNYYKM